MNTTKIDQNLSSKKFWRNAGILLAFTVLAVNLSFIVISESSNPGLVNDAYNEYGSRQYLIDIQYRNQLERGWDVDLKIPQTLVMGNKYSISLKVLDKDKLPLVGGRAELACYRPSDINKDVYFELKENTILPGIYFSDIELDELGTWDANVLFKIDDKTHILHRRINVVSEAQHQEQSRTLLEKIAGFLLGKSS